MKKANNGHHAMKLKWSCDERDRKECRNAHGCHCREITNLLAAKETLSKFNHARAKLITRQREALEHARARFQCLAEDFKGDECNVNWAMCSVDAERMIKALTVPTPDLQ